MSIVSHTVTTSPQSATRVNVIYTFIDHLGVQTVIRSLVENAFDTEAAALSMYPLLEEQDASAEIMRAFAVAEEWKNPDRAADYQPQADFDRRLLARLMTVVDVQVFYAGLPFFQAMEGRGGANANQRASYLGVIRDEYDLMSNRFGDVQGVAFFLDDDKNAVWHDIPEDWE